MSNIQIISISGKQGSGKTTLQNDLIRVLHSRKGTRCHVVNFADPLYKMHNYCLGVLKTLGIERDIVKDGPLLQLLGTEWGRKTVSENIWVDALHGQIKSILDREGRGNEKNVFIIGDCRFPNEFHALSDALRIRLECEREVRKARCSMWRENDQHPSEVGLDEYAEQGKFDLYFDTAIQAVPECSAFIAKCLDRNEWAGKRKE